MFDYFINCSSNPQHVYCEDSPTKGLYNLLSSLKVTTASQSLQMLNLYYNSHISDSILSYMTSKLGIAVDLFMEYNYARS